jgi:hypothetical protein
MPEVLQLTDFLGRDDASEFRRQVELRDWDQIGQLSDG